MVRFVLVLVTLMMTYDPSEANCPEAPCQCLAGLINCTCTGREDVFVGSMNGFLVTSLDVHHCGEVTISHGAFANSDLEALVINDVTRLRVEGFAFQHAHFLDHINLTDIAEFEPSVFSFTGLGNVSQIYMMNVQAESFPQGFLGANTVNYFIMEGCKVDAMEYWSLVMDHVDYVIVSHCSFPHMKTRAIDIKSTASQVTFHDNEFELMETEAILINAIHILTFNVCRFDTLQSRFLEVYVGLQVNFVNNKVNLCDVGAFSGMNETFASGHTKLTMENNAFNRVELGGLPSFFDLENVTSVVNGNLFQCDCDQKWLWDAPGYDHFLNTSLCITDGEHVTQFKPLLEQGTCVKMVRRGGPKRSAASTTPEPEPRNGPRLQGKVGTNMAVSLVSSAILMITAAILF